MKTPLTLILMLFISVYSCYGQIEKKILPNKIYSKVHLSASTPVKINCFLIKNHYYWFMVRNESIDVTIDLRAADGKKSKDKDSSYGIGDPARISFSPDVTGKFSLLIKRKNIEKNPKEGNFSIVLNSVSKILKTYKLSALKKDFNILKKAYMETRVGLWYNSYQQFDSLCKVQESKLKPSMNALEFYQILAPIASFTKEGHCYIRPSLRVDAYTKQNGKYFPFKVKILEGKVYLLNDLETFKTKGLELLKINGNKINTIMKQFLSIEPSDGYNLTGKYHWIAEAFYKYYLFFFEKTPKSFTIEALNPKTNRKITYANIPSYPYKKLRKYFQKLKKTMPNSGYKQASNLTINPLTSTAILTINSFDTYDYKNERKGFKDYLKKSFGTILKKNIQNLIIDVRKNEGGEQGMEDDLLSYLIDKPYTKYQYVEIPSFTYSFLKYTYYRNKSNILAKRLKEDFYHTKDGRYLNRVGHYAGEAQKVNNFKGRLYILISGLTFSGGSEFAALAKNYTNAIFIGEETSGGFYGNTSGSFLKFTLPNTLLKGRIPLCKYVVKSIKTDIPFGRGILPDYKIQPTIGEYLNGFDTELEFAKKLITK